MTKVLLIEDEKNLLESLVIIIEANGIECISAQNGSDGIALLHSGLHSVDLILCDINLPDMSGYDILAVVKKDKTLYKIPFVFLTAYADEKDVRAGMNLGADDYLTKPVGAKELVEAIRSRIIVDEQKKTHKQEEINSKWLSILNANFKQEFFTPINGILNASFLLGDAQMPMDIDALQNTVQAIYISSFRMYRNARNLVLFSLITTNKLSSYETIISKGTVNSVLDNVMQWYHNGLIKNKIDVDICDSGIPLGRYDRELLNVLFTELVDNALKFNAGLVGNPVVSLETASAGFTFSTTNNFEQTIDFELSDVRPYKKFHKDESYVGLGLGLFLCIHLAGKLDLDLKIFKDEGSITVTLSSR
jgi:CheY-like chemotaxis protein